VIVIVIVIVIGFYLKRTTDHDHKRLAEIRPQTSEDNTTTGNVGIGIEAYISSIPIPTPNVFKRHRVRHIAREAAPKTASATLHRDRDRGRDRDRLLFDANNRSRPRTTR